MAIGESSSVAPGLVLLAPSSIWRALALLLLIATPTMRARAQTPGEVCEAAFIRDALSITYSELNTETLRSAMSDALCESRHTARRARFSSAFRALTPEGIFGGTGSGDAWTEADEQRCRIYVARLDEDRLRSVAVAIVDNRSAQDTFLQCIAILSAPQDGFSHGLSTPAAEIAVGQAFIWVIRWQPPGPGPAARISRFEYDRRVLRCAPPRGTVPEGRDGLPIRCTRLRADSTTLALHTARGNVSQAIGAAPPTPQPVPTAPVHRSYTVAMTGPISIGLPVGCVCRHMGSVGVWRAGPTDPGSTCDGIGFTVSGYAASSSFDYLYSDNSGSCTFLFDCLPATADERCE